MFIKILIHTNTVRQELPVFEVSPTCSAKEVFSEIIRQLEVYGFEDINRDVLFSENGTPISKENILDFVTHGSLCVIYRNILAPYGAHNYDFHEGIRYFFHSSEKCHLKEPHIHAEYDHQEIKISLTDFSVIGRFSKRTKMNVAINYVKEHIDDLLIKWANWVSHN